MNSIKDEWLFNQGVVCWFMWWWAVCLKNTFKYNVMFHFFLSLWWFPFSFYSNTVWWSVDVNYLLIKLSMTVDLYISCFLIFILPFLFTCFSCSNSRIVWGNVPQIVISVVWWIKINNLTRRMWYEKISITCAFFCSM